MTQEDLSVYSPIDNGGLIAGGTVFLLRFLPFLGGWRGYSLGQYLVLITWNRKTNKLYLQITFSNNYTMEYLLSFK